MTRMPMLCCLLLSGCVIGAQGEQEFSESFSVRGIETVRLALPSTPLPVRGCGPAGPQCPEQLEVDGRWLSIAGTKDDAKDYAARGRLEFQELRGFGRLLAVKPLELEDLLDLELREARLPRDRDLELRTTVGDVTVDGMTEGVTVDVDVGDVDIVGGGGGVAVSTGRGRVRVETPGFVDVHSGRGALELFQSGPRAQDAYLFTEAGDVVVELASDADVELLVWAPGRIDVDTDRMRTITSGFFARQTGEGTATIEVVTEFGDVSVEMY